MTDFITAYDIRVLREIARRYGGERKDATWFRFPIGTRQNTGPEDCKLFADTLYKVCRRIEELAVQYPGGLPPQGVVTGLPAVWCVTSKDGGFRTYFDGPDAEARARSSDDARDGGSVAALRIVASAQDTTCRMDQNQ